MPDENEGINNYVDSRFPGSTETKSVPYIPPSAVRGGVGSRGIGYHQANQRMVIFPEKEPSKKLYAHYDPNDFSEELASEYEVVPLVGNTLLPIVYKTSTPRKWTMKLLFNDLGADDSARTGTGVRTAQESIDYIRAFIYPPNYQGSVSITGSDKPPVLLVFLINQVFRCCLTNATVKRLKIHPQSRKALRVEVDVTFVEFVEGEAQG